MYKKYYEEERNKRG
ncbi:MAG: hypothetical protein ACK5V3_15385 [Bdellovibrionales bacterium]